MVITSHTSGYQPSFIQSHPVIDNTDHLKTYVFKFFSKKTKLFYIIRCEYHKYDFIALKFYAKMHRKSDNKYSKIINRGDIFNILKSCASVVPIMLNTYPNASFGLVGSRTIDLRARKIENYNNNQRFKLYRDLIPRFISSNRFIHKSYEKASSYIIFNKTNHNSNFEKQILDMVCDTYPDLLNVRI